MRHKDRIKQKMNVHGYGSEITILRYGIYNVSLNGNFCDKHTGQ